MKQYSLPEYPCHKDVWDILKEEKRPILVYGMGNGADKLFLQFEKYGITVSDVFASDGFVRGHSFRGYKVKSFSEVKAQYPDFVIVLSFASNKKDVIRLLASIDAEYEMYVPDMPIAGVNEYFNREFYNKNYEKIKKAYSILADDESKNIFAAVLNYRLSGKLSYLLDSCTKKEDMYELINKRTVKKVIDCGAYRGDTAAEAIEYFPHLEAVYAIEPDKRSYKKLLQFAESAKKRIIPINAAVWNDVRMGELQQSGNRNSSISSTASYEHKADETQLISVDSLSVFDADYIKYDVEGAEYEALVGSAETVKKAKPALLVSLYHRSGDVFRLVEYLYSEYPEYRFYVRRLSSVPAWELNLIMIPNTIE
jgi:FkbM family methyltransferase